MADSCELENVGPNPSNFGWWVTGFVVLFLLVFLSFYMGKYYQAQEELQDLNNQVGMDSCLRFICYGAGSSMIAPMYQAWEQDLAAGIASQGKSIPNGFTEMDFRKAIDLLLNQKIGWVSTECPLPRDELIQNHLFQWPILLCAEAIIVHLPDGTGNETLKLSQKNLANIFLGKLTRWNDPELVKDNPNIKLPDLPVLPIVRSGNSGSAFMFSNFLAAVSPEWKEKVGCGANLVWPTGKAVDFAREVQTVVEKTPGAIGFIGSTSAQRTELVIAAVENADGQFVQPSIKSIQAVERLLTLDMYDDFTPALTNPKGADVYPLVCMSYTLISMISETDPGCYQKRSDRWALTNWCFSQRDAIIQDGCNIVLLSDEYLSAIHSRYNKELRHAAGQIYERKK